jgi:glucose/arabinose dehydrogenase
MGGDSWPSGATPKPASGLQVRAFAQAASEPAKTGSSPHAVVQSNAQRRSGSVTENANRISILRDAHGDGVVETQAVFLEGLRPAAYAFRSQSLHCGQRQ